MKYRKKPVVVEVEQWFPDKEVAGVIYEPINHPVASIQTLEGRMLVRPGDYIITGIKGEKYPCRQDIFEATYELVE